MAWAQGSHLSVELLAWPFTKHISNQVVGLLAWPFTKDISNKVVGLPAWPFTKISPHP